MNVNWHINKKGDKTVLLFSLYFVIRIKKKITERIYCNEIVDCSIVGWQMGYAYTYTLVMGSGSLFAPSSGCGSLILQLTRYRCRCRFFEFVVVCTCKSQIALVTLKINAGTNHLKFGRKLARKCFFLLMFFLFLFGSGFSCHETHAFSTES